MTIPTSDPFELLGVPARFDLSPAQLRAAFLARSAQLASEDEEPAAALNLAKRTLDDPESRAEALLARLGGPRKEQDRALPPAFLQEMLETREELDQAVASRSPEAISHWDAWAHDRRAAHIEAVNRLLSTIPADAEARTSRLREIRMELNMWRYVERLIEQLHADPDAPRP